MEAKTKRLLESTKEYALITLGLLMYSLGWVFFLIPNGMVGGGVTGIGVIIYYLTSFPVSYSFFLINLILLAIGLKILGKGFGAKSVYAIIICTLFLKILPDLVPQEIIEDIAIGNGKLLSALIGGALAGSGIALTFTQGGSSGGTDIIALIVNKYRNISPGKVILISDLIIVLCSLLVPSTEGVGGRVATVIYGLVLISVTGYSIDLFISGAKQSVQLFIFSNRYKEIADRIAATGRGVTVIEAMGWYTKESGRVLMVIVRRTEINFIFKTIKEVDKEAFISLANVMGVFGKGFDTIKK
ncbi:MAG: YitT family protein [Bacteroidales bacterium]